MGTFCPNAKVEWTVDDGQRQPAKQTRKRTSNRDLAVLNSVQNAPLLEPEKASAESSWDGRRYFSSRWRTWQTIGEREPTAGWKRPWTHPHIRTEWWVGRWGFRSAELSFWCSTSLNMGVNLPRNDTSQQRSRAKLYSSLCVWVTLLYLFIWKSHGSPAEVMLMGEGWSWTVRFYADFNQTLLLIWGQDGAEKNPAKLLWALFSKEVQSITCQEYVARGFPLAQW